jgi:hypothetical protein
MALNKYVTNSMIFKSLENINSKCFTTIEFINVLTNQDKKMIKFLRDKSKRNWRSVVGIALSRFEKQTQKIKKLSPISETPARWEVI